MRHALFETSDVSGETCELSSDLCAIQAVVRSPAWRANCLKGRRRFSAITTYLSQLMGHDFVRTADENTRFDPDLASGQDLDAKRARKPDLRRGSFFMNTIYGRGMHIDHGLYQNAPSSASIKSAKFKLLRLEGKEKNLRFYSPAFQILATPEGFRRHMEPIIADRRNMDNAVLMLLTAIFMQFHNQMVDASQEETKVLRYLDARIKTILMWHNIIETDVVNQTTTSKRRLFSPTPMLRDGGVHAAFRCFHSLALPNYTIRKGKTESLSRLLSARATSPEFVISPANAQAHTKLKPWADVWAIDWTEFTKNKTCFTPSLSEGFAPENIFGLDIKASEAHLGSANMAPDEMNDDVKTMIDAMSDYFPAGQTVGANFERSAPLLIQLMAEAFVKGHRTGKLGPNGSQLVRQTIERELDASRAQLDAMFPFQLAKVKDETLPKNFSQLFDTVNPNHKSEEHLSV